MKIKLLFLFVSYHCFLSAQEARYKASIDISHQSGYQKIRLSPELVAVSKSDLSDIRVWDKNLQQVPYFIVYTQPTLKQETKKTILKEYKINNFLKQTLIHITNIQSKTIDHLAFNINNTSITKSYSVLGSKDGISWYAISENQVLNDLISNDKTSVEKIIYLPKTNYGFYKIIINDSNSAPIVINQITIYDDINWVESEKIKLKNYKFQFLKQKNDNVLEYSSNYKFKIDELQFNLNETGLYQRNFSISTEQKIRKRKQDVVVYQNEISDKSQLYTGINLTESKFKIHIYNGDNRALSISSIDCYQYPIYLIAAIDSMQPYSISSGDVKLTMPSYDIVNFRDKIQTLSPLLSVSKLEFIKQDNLIFSKSHFYQQKWFMWLCLGLGVVTILFISLSMINAMSKKENV
jgi:hypothetical protein